MLWSTPNNFEHGIWLAGFVFVWVMLVVATVRTLQRLGNTALDEYAVSAAVLAATVMGILSMSSLIAHESVWIARGTNLRFLLRLPFVFIGAQMAAMFAIYNAGDRHNVAGHLAVRARAKTWAEWSRWAAHTAVAQSCRVFTATLAVLAALLTLCLAIITPIVSFSSVRRVPGGFAAYVSFVWALMACGVFSAMYAMLREAPEVQHDQGWQSCRLILQPAFIFLYVILGFLGFDEASRDANAAPTDGTDSHILAVMVAMYYALVVIHGEFLRRYDVRVPVSEAPPPLPPSQGWFSRFWKTKPPPPPPPVEDQPLITSY